MLGDNGDDFIMTGRKSTKSNLNKKMCVTCNKEKYHKNDFYTSNNDFHKNDGKFPVCKDCILLSLNYDNLETIYDVLRQMNRPFLIEVWEKSVIEAKKSNKEIFGVYYKNILLNNKTLTWNNSILNQRESVNNNYSQEDLSNHHIDFNVTKDMIIRWGSNYSTEDYMKLENFYDKMMLSNKIETPQEIEYLRKLAVISIKMDKELESGNYAQVKQLGDLFSKYMTDSKLRAMDKSEADKTGGIRNFSTIFAEVEKDGNIPPWEEYRKIKGLTQDIVDQTIMHIENFTLRLNRIDRMVEPPHDTPVVTDEDTDIFEGEEL